MINVLVICKDIENAKKLINNVVCKIDNLKLSGIANNFTEAATLLINNEINLIISTSHKVIKFVKLNFITYTPTIIIIDNKIRIIDSYPKVLLLSNNSTLDEIKNKISLFLTQNIEQVKKEKISRILINLGFNFKWSGTVYLLDSILYANSYKGSYHFEKIKKDVYSYVAKQNNTTSDKVKWSIERAIKYIFKEHNKNTYKNIEMLLNIKYPSKPKSKHLISTIANKLDFIK